MSEDGGGDDDGGVNLDGDEFVETTSNSYGEKLKSGVAGLCIGPLIMIGACVLLFWNEGRNVNRIRNLDKALGAVQVVNATSKNGIDYSLEGALVHLSGSAFTRDEIYDEDFGLSINALKLSRSVETYQWTEHTSTKQKKTSNGSTTRTTTYSYRKEWRGGLQDSSSFKNSANHENPGQVLLYDSSQVADEIILGNYALMSAVVNKINWYEALSASADLSVQNIPNGSVVEHAFVSGEYFYVAANGNDKSSSPQVGDTRISFSQVPSPTTVSVLAKQFGSQLETYVTSRGGSVLLVERGTISAVNMIANAKTENAYWTWGIRVAGLVLTFIGFQVACSLVTTVLDILPGPFSIVDDLLEAGVACVGGIVSIVLSFSVIAVAWIFYRPLIGGCILAAVAVITGISIYLQRKRKKNKTDGANGGGTKSDGKVHPTSEVEANGKADNPYATTIPPVSVSASPHHMQPSGSAISPNASLAPSEPHQYNMAQPLYGSSPPPYSQQHFNQAYAGTAPQHGTPQQYQQMSSPPPYRPSINSPYNHQSPAYAIQHQPTAPVYYSVDQYNRPVEHPPVAQPVAYAFPPSQPYLSSDYGQRVAPSQQLLRHREEPLTHGIVVDAHISMPPEPTAPPVTKYTSRSLETASNEAERKE